jgi:hypothetical protein
VLFQGTFNDPHMEINGEVKKISVDYWGQQTLSPEEYQRFKAAAYRQHVMWSQMLSNGRAEMTKDTNTASTTVTLHEIVLHDPEYVKYMRQMLRDPAVTWPGPGIKPIY